MVKYLCGERGVPVKNAPADEGAWTKELDGTPLALALTAGHEEIALYLLSLPRGEDSPPLNLDKPPCNQHKNNCMPLLTAAAIHGMARVVEVLLGLDADLLASDAVGHLAICRAVQKCHVDVANVLL